MNDRRLLVALALCVGACGDGTRLDVRTTLPRDVRDAVEEGFELKYPDVDVRLSSAGADESLAELRDDPAAFDVWWGVPALTLEAASGEGLLAGYDPPWIGGPSRIEAREGMDWHMTMATPFVIAFDRTTVPIADAPVDWIDVLHHGWFGEVTAFDPVATLEGSHFAGAILVEALRDDDDLNRGFDWLTRLDRQVQVYARDAESMILALEAGSAMLAVMPRADAERARTGDDPWIHYRLPESGTPLLVRGTAVTAEADPGDAARRFVDYVGSREVTTLVAVSTRWEPVYGELDESRLPRDFELDQPWEPWQPAFDTLRAHLDGWMRRWETDIGAR